MTSLLPPPPAFRGTWRTGEEAGRRAGEISGPFRLDADPAAWAAPIDTEDLSRVILHAGREGIPIIPRGGGTGMPGGNLGPGIVVSMEAFRERSLLPGGDEPRIRAGASVTAEAVDALAGTRGLEFPPLPSSAAWATVGGLVANNAAGARSFGHGAVDRWVEGVEGVDAQGAPLDLEPGAPPPPGWETALGSPPPLPFRLRKNSSGYGIDRYHATGNPAQLIVGSEGTLLLVTAATLRLRPRAPAMGVVLLPVFDADEAGALAMEAAGLGAVACEFLGRRLLDMAGLKEDPELGPLAREAFALFLLAFEGDSAREVESALARALRSPGIATRDPAVAARLWGLRRRASPLIAAQAGRGRFSTQFIEDSVVPPHRLGAYLQGLDRILREEGRGMDAVVFGHAGDGNVHVNPLVDLSDPGWRTSVREILEGVVDLVVELGGTLAGEHGDGRLRAPFLRAVWGEDWSARFRGLKDAADPSGLLNPGVILPLPGQDPLAGLAPRARSWPHT